MTSIKVARPWDLPESQLTHEPDFWNRRRFLQAAGLAAVGGGLLARSLLPNRVLAVAHASPGPGIDVPRAKAFSHFVEFSQWSAETPGLAMALDTDSWPVTISGLVEKPRVIEAGELRELMTLEERAYRFRCVEGWAMVVPWIGFPLKRLISLVQPKSSARYVRFSSFHDPRIAPSQRQQDWHRWPYSEAISLAEAVHDLAFLVTGVYGRSLPKAQGAPLRLVLPWKYAMKSIKSITRIEFVQDRPETFWGSACAERYDFDCNVQPVAGSDPLQADEILIGSGQRRPTLPYNGYGEMVASLYR